MAAPRNDLRFVSISHPSEAVGWRRQVRSHVASVPRQRRPKRAHVLVGEEAPAAQGGPANSFHTNATRREDGPALRLSLSPSPRYAETYRRLWPTLSLREPAPTTLSAYEYSLLEYFLTNMIPQTRLGSTGTTPRPSDESRRKALASDWLQWAAHDPSLMDVTLLVSSQNIFMTHRNENCRLVAMVYRSRCITDLARRLSDASFTSSESAIAKSIFLFCDSAMLRDTFAVAAHAVAVRQMAASWTKRQNLAENDFMAGLLSWFEAQPSTHGIS